MPAKSVAQRRYFAMCEHDELPDEECPRMSKSETHDFASTPEKNLPRRKESLSQFNGRQKRHGKLASMRGK